MNIALLNTLRTVSWDFRRDMAQSYANALRNAIELHIGNDVEKQEGFFLSMKGYQADGRNVGANFEDKLYFGNIHRIESHLYYNDEELAEDDQIINVVVINGPVTRDGGACSYGTKDFRDQVLYANQIPQVVFHLFIVNTPGGESACRNDYDMMIDDCREKGKPTVMLVDGMCCSSGVNLGCRMDRVIVMNPKDDFGCIGSMAAFWATPDGAVDSRDGTRFIEIVGDDSPEKNDWYREAAQGNYEKLREMINKDTEEFHQTVRENRPLVEDWMLTGKVFEAQEVIPALVDEIGDLNRAIECGFALADQTMTAARFMQAEPKEEEPGHEPGEEPEELAKLNGQQKAAMAAEAGKGNLVMAEDGHVTKEIQTIFGPAEQEIAQPKNENNMPNEEELKAQEAAAAQAAQEQEQQQEQQAEEQEAQEAEQQEQQAQEQEAEQQQAEEQEAEQQEQQEAEQQEQQAPASQENIENAQAEIDKIQETLHSAEQMIADKDKEIADLKEKVDSLEGVIEERDAAQAEVVKKADEVETLNSQLSTLNSQLSEKDKSIEEKDALIEQLKKQVADLKAEVKELAGKPAPMTDEKSGIPADNGTGAAPETGAIGSAINDNMTLEEKREAIRKQDKELKERREKSMR